MIQNIDLIGQTRKDFIHHSVVQFKSQSQLLLEKALDIGCSYGWGLASLTEEVKNLVGIDMDTVALNEARKNYPHITFVEQNANILPFQSQEFDVVILSEVIEHVGEENKALVINEAHRVLKENGLFIFTAPYTGLFAWADPLDFKRRFPGLYKVYMRVSKYTPSTSIEIGHKHLSLEEIERLFDNRFQIEQIRYCGLIMPFLTWILAINKRIKLLPPKWHHQLNRFRAWEGGLVYPRQLAFNIRLYARKK